MKITDKRVAKFRVFKKEKTLAQNTSILSDFGKVLWDSVLRSFCIFSCFPLSETVCD